MVKETIKKGQPWTDNTFLPVKSSLFDAAIDTKNTQIFEDLQWKRASEIYQSPAIFKDGIEPNDVNQGALGDCYFLAALSSLAEFPHRIRAMFITDTINTAGIYLIRFFLNGKETPVVVDDHLPVKADGTPAFATCRDGELWVSLLEKAWAKLHGSYARMEGGLPSFAASHLAGVPAESYLHDEIENKEDFFAMLELADKRNFIMMAASRDAGEAAGADGVVTGHAYSLIDIYRL